MWTALVGQSTQEVRGWTPWHRFVTLAMLALAFISMLAAAAAPPNNPDLHHHAHNGGPIALTTPEIRRLFSTLHNPPNHTQPTY